MAVSSENGGQACDVCQGESLGATIGPDGSLVPRRCGACADLVTIDPSDPEQWGPAVERAAKEMAAGMWGPAHWYRGVANRALTAAFPGLDVACTARVVAEFHAKGDDDAC